VDSIVTQRMVKGLSVCLLHCINCENLYWLKKVMQCFRHQQWTEFILRGGEGGTCLFVTLYKEWKNDNAFVGVYIYVLLWQNVGKYEYGTVLQLIIVNIFQSVAVYTGYVVTEHKGNMNMGQYYS
jgi:uncharacterized membrane protein YobD (UPF0266 family)